MWRKWLQDSRRFLPGWELPFSPAWELTDRISLFFPAIFTWEIRCARVHQVRVHLIDVIKIVSLISLTKNKEIKKNFFDTLRKVCSADAGQTTGYETKTDDWPTSKYVNDLGR